MSLDQNLFTLNFVARTDNPNVIDLTDPLGTVHYRKELVDHQGTLYEFNLIGMSLNDGRQQHSLTTLQTHFRSRL